MTDIPRPEVFVGEDGVIQVWLTPDQEDPIVMTQRDWAMLTIEVDSELSMRRMDLSERRQFEYESDEMAELEPDWVEHALACAEAQELMETDRAWWDEKYPDPMRNVVQVWPEGQFIGEPVTMKIKSSGRGTVVVDHDDA